MGADDRAGVCAILQLIPHLPDCTIVFTVDEEMGCKGSGALDIAELGSPNIMLSFDRRGCSDAIYHTNGVDCASEACKAWLLPVYKAYGYSYASGTSTDIGELKKSGVICSAFNLSIGYKREHTRNEALNVTDYSRAMSLGLSVITAMRDKDFPYIVKREPAPLYNQSLYQKWIKDMDKDFKHTDKGKAKKERPWRDWYSQTFFPGLGRPSGATTYVNGALDRFEPCDMCGKVRQVYNVYDKGVITSMCAQCRDDYCTVGNEL
jgi:hypothetical protein